MKKIPYEGKLAGSFSWWDWTIVPILQKWVQQNPEKAGEWHRVKELFQELRLFAKSQNMEWYWDSSVGLANHLRSPEVIEQIREEIGVQMSWVHVPRQTHLFLQYRFGATLPEKANPSNGE